MVPFLTILDQTFIYICILSRVGFINPYSYLCDNFHNVLSSAIEQHKSSPVEMMSNHAQTNNHISGKVTFYYLCLNALCNRNSLLSP